MAAEFFASIADARVIAGELAEDPENSDTADGRPLTMEHAKNRLAHMLCCDLTELSAAELRSVSDQVIARQRAALSAALEKVVTTVKQLLHAEDRSTELEPVTFAISGSGSSAGDPESRRPDNSPAGYSAVLLPHFH